MEKQINDKVNNDKILPSLIELVSKTTGYNSYILLALEISWLIKVNAK